jgi:hypothetical protein
MTEHQVRREIFLAITECTHYDRGPLVQRTEDAHTLNTAVLDALKEKGLLVKLDDDSE